MLMLIWMLVTVGSVFTYAGACYLALRWRRHIGRKASALRDDELPGVTILKPLCGLEDELEENLESFARLDYPRLQLVFGCRDQDDPALNVARRVVARHPKVAIQFATGSHSSARNPKVANLEIMLPHAQGELCMFSDSDARVEPGDLRRLIVPFRDPRVGLVYQPAVGLGEQTAAAAAENMFVTEYVGLLTIAINACTGVNAPTGKGLVFRRSALSEAGDLRCVRDGVGDDYILAQAVARAGWKIVMADVLSWTIHSGWSWRSFWERRVRHSAVHWRVAAWAYPLFLIFNPVALATVGLLFCTWQSLVVCVAVIVVKTALELSSSALLRQRAFRLRHVPLVVIKDWLLAASWVVALVYHRVTWRSQVYRIGPKTRLTPLSVATQIELGGCGSAERGLRVCNT
jgi:ceramide glucosyltransferase